jgi:hypothetical protein
MPRAHSSGRGFQTHAPTLEQHAGRTEDRASQIHQHAQSVGGTSMPGHALGSLGSGHASALNSHYQHAGTAVRGAGDRLNGIAGNERTNAANYRNTETDNAARFRSIMSDPTPTGSPANSRPSTPTPATPATPTPAPPPPPLYGIDPKTGKRIPFQPGDVQSIPLHDSNGKLIGVSFPTKPADSTAVPAWAASDRKSDSEFRPARIAPPPPAAPTTPAGAPYPPRPSGATGGPTGAGPARTSRPPRPARPAPKWSFDPAQATPWSTAGTPVYVHAHANPNHFAVNVNGQTVLVDGTTHGQVIAGNQHYQQAAGANPNSPLVMMSCSSAKPGGTAAGSAAAYLHSHGDGRDIYAPTGTGIRMTNPVTGVSQYGVEETVDASGRPAPGSFQHYPPPPPPGPPTPPPAPIPAPSAPPAGGSSTP